MRRSRLRAALLIVVAAVLAGIGFLVSRTMTAGRRGTVAELGQDLLPGAAQRIRNFRRAKVKNGRTVWEITAEDARYFEPEQAIIVVEPRLTVHLDDGARQATLRGAEGRLMLDGQELARVTLRGGVTLRLDDLELETEEATYDRSRDLITSGAPVAIRGPAVELHGRGLEVQVEPQLVRILDDVHTTFRSHAARS